MGLLKGSRLSVTPGPFSMTDIGQRAAMVIARAQSQAEQIVADARAEADSLRKAAYARGEAEGKAHGMKEGRDAGAAAARQQALSEHKAKLVELITALTGSASHIDASLREIEQHVRRDLIDLALQISLRVCKTLGAVEPGVIEANLDEAIRLVVSKHSIRVRISSQQRDLLQETLSDLKLKWPQLRHVELVGDASISPGGCVLSSGGGEIDATIEKQLDRIRDELLPRREARPLRVVDSISKDEVLD